MPAPAAAVPLLTKIAPWLVGGATIGVPWWMMGREEKKLQKALTKRQAQEQRNQQKAMAILAMAQGMRTAADRAAGTTPEERALTAGFTPRVAGLFGSSPDEGMGDMVRSLLAADLGPEYAKRIAEAASSRMPPGLRGYR